MDMKNAGVLITGASRGLGLELSRALAREGARVVMVARGKDELNHAVTLVRDAAQAGGQGGEAHGLAFDVGDKEAAHRIAFAAFAVVSPIVGLIHAASTLGPVPMPLLLDTNCEDFEDVLAVNLLGPFRLTKIIAGSMLVRERGVVIFVSSDAAVNAYPHWGAYGISKAAQDHLARTFAAELKPIHFFALDPGEMNTKMHADALPEADPSTLSPPGEIAERILTLMGRSHSFSSGARIVAADLPPYEAEGAAPGPDVGRTERRAP